MCEAFPGRLKIWIGRALSRDCSSCMRYPSQNASKRSHTVLSFWPDPEECDSFLTGTPTAAAVTSAATSGTVRKSVDTSTSATSAASRTTDVESVFQEIKDRNARVGVISDIHFDIRPAFDSARLPSLIDSFVLGYISLRRYLDRLGRAAEEKGAEVSHDDVRNLQRGIVPTGVELRPVHDIGVVALGERPDGLEIMREHRDTDASLAHDRLGPGMTLAVVVAHRCGGSVGQPIERYLGENLLHRHQAGSVAEVLEQLVVRQLTDRRIRQRSGNCLRARTVHLVVAAHRLEPTQKLQSRVLLGPESLHLTWIARRERKQLEHVCTQEARRI